MIINRHFGAYFFDFIFLLTYNTTVGIVIVADAVTLLD